MTNKISFHDLSKEEQELVLGAIKEPIQINIEMEEPKASRAKVQIENKTGTNYSKKYYLSCLLLIEKILFVKEYILYMI